MRLPPQTAARFGHENQAMSRGAAVTSTPAPVAMRVQKGATFSMLTNMPWPVPSLLGRIVQPCTL
jgi:hypothetical protein